MVVADDDADADATATAKTVAAEVSPCTVVAGCEDQPGPDEAEAGEDPGHGLGRCHPGHRGDGGGRARRSGRRSGPRTENPGAGARTRRRKPPRSRWRPGRRGAGRCGTHGDYRRASSARTGRWSEPPSGRTSPRTISMAPRTRMWSIWLWGFPAGQVGPLTARCHSGQEDPHRRPPQVHVAQQDRIGPGLAVRRRFLRAA